MDKFKHNYNADLDGEISRFLNNNNNYRYNHIKYKITPKEQKILDSILHKQTNDRLIARKTSRRNLNKLILSLAPTQYSKYIKNRVNHILNIKSTINDKNISNEKYHNKLFLSKNNGLKNVNKITLKNLISKNLSYINNQISGNKKYFSVTDNHGNTYNVKLLRKNGKYDYYYVNGYKKGKRVQIFNGYKLAPADSNLYGTPNKPERKPTNIEHNISNKLRRLRKYVRLSTIRKIEKLSENYNFKNKVINFLLDASKKGYNVEVSQGRRTINQQRRIMQKGNVTWVKSPNRSMHTKGLAVDILYNNNYNAHVPKALVKIAAKYGLWNGTEMWEDAGISDDNHFQAFYTGVRSKKRNRLAKMKRRGTLPRNV